MTDPETRSLKDASPIERQAFAWLANMQENPARYRQAFETWLSGDPARVEAYAWAEARMGAATQAAPWARLPRLSIKSSPRPARRLRTGLSFAVGLMAASLIGIAVYEHPEALLHPGAASHQKAQYATQTSEIRRIQLADGSLVVLDADSAIRVAYQADRRQILLDRGRARFVVAHDPARPFIVLAGGGSVTARGTVFDVSVRQDVEVALIRGAVEVSGNAAATDAARTIIWLRPGEKTSFKAGQTAASLTPPSPPQPMRRSDAQWVTGMKAFDDVPVSEIVAEANAYSSTKIVIADPAIGAREAFIELEIRDVHQVAAKLATLLDLVAEQAGPNTIVLRAR